MSEEMLLKRNGEVKPTLGAAGSVRLSSARHIDLVLVGWLVIEE